MSRPDANAIALRAIRALLSAEVPPSISVLGKPVELTATREPQPFVPDIEGLVQERDGPWPERLNVHCHWTGGHADFVLRAVYTAFQSDSQPRRAVALRIAEAGSLNEIVFQTIAYSVWSKNDGEIGAVTPAASFIARQGESPAEVAGFTRQLQSHLAKAGIPLRGAFVDLAGIEPPGGNWTMPAVLVLERLLTVALLKLPFLLRHAPQHLHGEQLIPVVRQPVQTETTGPAPTAEKRAGIWPLPGGVRSHVETLKRILGWLQNEGLPESEVDARFESDFNVKGATALSGYKYILGNIGYCVLGPDRVFALTEEGRTWLADPDVVDLFERLHQAVTGVLDTLVIVSKNGPIRVRETFELLKPLLQATWETDVQTSFRRNWLLSLGLTERTPAGDTISDAGREVLAKHAVEVHSIATRLEGLTGAVAPNAEPAEVEVAEAKHAIDVSTRVDLSPARVKEQLASYLRFPEDVIAMAAGALSSGHHLLLVGPPGSGKTELAVELARIAQIEEYCKGARVTTASADWTTYDTIGGYAVEPKDGLTTMKFRPGVFLEALANRQWLLIDELNRADIDRAFGELMTVLSGKGVTTSFRQDDGSVVRIAMAQDADSASASHVVPRTFRVIATMNSWDKSSLFKLSYALQRRFAIVFVGPPVDNVYGDLLRAAANDGSECPPLEQDVTDAVVGLFTQSGVLKWRAVGPAIGKDMVRYLRQRQAGKQGLAEALSMYLLPQLEGIERRDAGDVRKRLLAVVEGEAQAERTLKLRMDDMFGAEASGA